MLTIDEILQQNSAIFRDVLENDSIVLTPETTADHIGEWDSLTHIQLIVALEKHYKIRFSTAEITSFRNVGELCASIRQKLAR